MALPRDDQRFKNLTVDYKKMTRLSMRDRLDMLGSKRGVSLLSSLDPSQLQALFPDYYKKDAGLAQTLSAITGRTIKQSDTVKDQTAGRVTSPTERDLRRRNMAARVREEEQLPEWARKLGVTARKSDEPQLTSEQKTVLAELRQGKIASDDPRVSFIADMSPEARERARINLEQVEGKSYFSYRSVTREEALAEAKTSGGNDATMTNIAQYIRSRATSMGVNPDMALGIALREGLNRNTIGSPTFGNKDARGYSFGPYQLYSGSPDPTQIAKGGMALEFQRRYGEPPNASNWQKQVDFSLEIMKQKGPEGLQKGPWYAVRDNGGIDRITEIGSKFASTLPREAVTSNETPTEEQIKQAQSRIEQRGEQAVASAQPRPQLPAGLDPKFVETYNRLPIAQAQQVARGLGKVSQEQGEEGIRKFNTEFLGNPRSTMSQVSVSDVGANRFSDSSVAGRFGQMKPSAQNATQRFLSFSPEATITSTYRDPSHPIESRKQTPGAHSRGEAVDVRTRDLSTEQIQQKIASLKRAGFNYVLLEGNPPHIHAEVREGRDFEIRNLGKGHPGISLEQAQQAAAGVRFRDFDEAEQQTQTAQATAEPQVAAFSYGGEMQTDAKQLTAVPMDSPRTDVVAPLDKRDNMAVIDEKGKTQFTINDNETVSLKDGKAEIQTEERVKSDEVKPIQAELAKEEDANRKQQDERLENSRMMALTDRQIDNTNMPRINEDVLTATDEMFKTPSFNRAMKERYFLKDESPMGGNHFSPV